VRTATSCSATSAAPSNTPMKVEIKLVGEGKYRHSDALRNESLDFVLNLGCVSAVVVGFEKKWEIDDFAARVELVKPKQKSAVA